MLVQRPRLLARLDESMDGKLALVQAPAGYGKTTLVLAWLEKIQGTIAWLSLDESDNDPRRFVTYVVSALNRALSDFGADLLRLMKTPGQEPALEAASTIVLNRLAELSTPTIFVLDDYHVLNSTSIDKIVTYWVEHLPANVQLVITSRSQPKLPLSRLRARGQLVEINQQALRFTLPETDDWLRRIKGIKLSDADVETLTRRTEGWPAGLRLAALSLQDASDLSVFVATFNGTNRLVVDYLVDEVLAQRSPETREFLLKTSILNSLCGPLCDTLLQGTDRNTPISSQQMLEELDAAGVFILPLDNDRRWYRYHSLFAQLLRDRMWQAYPDLPPLLHARASSWYASNERPAEAIRHALAAEDLALAVQLIELSAQEMIWRGQFVTLLDWLKMLSPEAIRTSPRLGISLALARLLSGRFKTLDAVDLPLLAAEEFLKTVDTPDKARLMAEVDSIRAAILVEQGETDMGLAMAEPAYRQLAADDSRYGGFLLGTLASTLGLAHRDNGRTEVAARFYTEAKTISESSDNIMITLLSAYELGKLRGEQGRLHQAETMYRRAMAWARDRFGASVAALPLSGAAHIGLGQLLLERNRLDEARQHLEIGVERTSHQGGLGIDRDGLLALAQVFQALNEADRASEMMDRAMDHARRSPRPDALSAARVAQARLWLAQGDITAAASWASTTEFPPCDAYPAESYSVARAMVYLAQGQPLPALDLLDQCVPVVETGTRFGRLVEILALQALAYQQLNQDDLALVRLERSLSLAEPEGYARLYLDLGQPMARLLYTTLQAGIAATYTGRLLAEFDDGDPPVHQSVSQPLVEPLSDRELEVLHLLSAGLSNREIALKLYLSPNTVKRHANNIYDKLGVHSRTEAAAKARTLGILD